MLSKYNLPTNINTKDEKINVLKNITEKFKANTQILTTENKRLENKFNKNIKNTIIELVKKRKYK